MKFVNRTITGTALAAVLGAPLLWAAGPAVASGAGVTSHGSCSQRGTFELKAKHDDGAIEVEYEVDTNVGGQQFTVRLTDNGVVIARRMPTTGARRGSFTVHTRTSNRAGADTIRAHAVFASNTCGGRVRV
jgi:hypothetical protein